MDLSAREQKGIHSLLGLQIVGDSSDFRWELRRKILININDREGN